MPQPLSSVVDIRIFPEKDQPGVHVDEVLIETEGLVGDRRKKSPVHAIAQADAADTRPTSSSPRPERLLDLVGQTVSGGARLTIVRRRAIAPVCMPMSSPRARRPRGSDVRRARLGHPRSSPLVRHPERGTQLRYFAVTPSTTFATRPSPGLVPCRRSAAIRGDAIAIPGEGVLGRPGQGVEVDVDQAETLGVAIGPLEVVQ